MLEMAASWNSWTADEQLLQLAGHLRGKAFQEWNVLRRQDKATYQSAIEALRQYMEPGAGSSGPAPCRAEGN